MAFDTLRQDVKGALRGLVKSPGFAVAALVTLALGIGATSAIFSVVRAVLLTPLPYADAERRVMIWSRWISFDKTWLSDAEYLDYRRTSRTFSDVAAWTTGQQNLIGDGEPVRVGVGFITANAFSVLGAQPLLGRSITPEEDRPKAAPVAVLGYPLWQSRFGGDPGVVGRTMLLNDVPVQIVGVMPEGFRLPTDFTQEAAEPTQLWRALQIDEQNLSRGSHGYYGAAVLRAGHTAATATDDLRSMTTQWTEQGLYPPAMQFSAFAVALDEEIRGGLRPAMWLLMGAVTCLLLIACTNVANLLLVRGDARLRELAVRTAIGAAPSRLMRQLLTESVVLSVCGALLGLGLAALGLRVLVRLDPTSLPPLAPVGLDGAVVAFTFIVGVATTLMFGLVPALRTIRLNLVGSLREGNQQATVGGGRHRLRGLLVATEMALALMLVVGAGLMIRSLGQLGRIDLGFNPRNVLTMRVALTPVAYDTPEKVVELYRQLLERVRTLPGVTHAGVVRALPLATTIGDWGLTIDGYVAPPGRDAKGDWQIVSDGAFEALGMRLVSGRWFDPRDASGSQPVAVVNETMARTYWAGGDAVGRRMRVGGANRPFATVVGIVADERHNGIAGEIKEKFYIPHSQWHVVTGGNLIRNVFLTVRTTDDPLALAGPVRAQIRQMDPQLPVANIRTMDDVVSTSLATPRLTGFLLATFALVALALAAVGIYGVLAYLVSQRTHEIGIRLAIGADRSQVLRMILRQGLTLALTGIAVGIVAALGLTRLMASLLYQVTPVDPVTFVVVPLLLALVALVASYLPARRATRVSPVIALRME